MAAPEGGSTARRDFLHKIELDVQQKWEEMKVWEFDAGDTAGDESDKFFVTFPYPYMNGLLHIGHAYSMTKAIFAVHFHRLLGKRALFPFGFHCTGMPIQAAANKLKREYERYGELHPTFPSGRPMPKEVAGALELDDAGLTLQWKAPASTGQRAIKVYHLQRREPDGEFKEIAQVPHPDAATLKAQGKKVVCKAPVVDSGVCIYKVVVELEDWTMLESKESDEVSFDEKEEKKDKKGSGPPGKRVAKKVLQKAGDATFQWEILTAMGLKPEELPPFTEPEYWLQFFPPLGARDLKRFGAPIDFRRSFITTSANPYYDMFIRWQFRKLKAADKIGFGKRPTIYSETDAQACMDHDRAEGEGVQPQEYTGIKMEVVELPKALSKLKGKTVFMVAATLRPETMCGQTNCWILPKGTYGCFAAGKKDVYVCSHRAARNMSFQDILEPWGKPQCLLEVTGQELLGTKLKAPTSPYDFVYMLPLLTIKMDKGTGVVTSVPSDSPDDYAAFMDLMKPGKRDHLGVKAEWVEPFKLIPIIDVEIDDEVRSMAAEYMCEKLGVQSQNDKEKLHEAHDVVYTLGFAKGIMTAGPMKGQPVRKAKVELRNMMVKAGQAFTYSEPEKKVVSRSGDECVVAGIDQWYLKYGEEGWKKQIEDHLHGPNFRTYNDRIKESFVDAITWLKEWACSRSFGLGTRVPWDEQFIIESLSDSTIYMAYYMIAHVLQGGVLDGSKGSPEGIKPEDLTDEVFDFIFLKGAPMPKKTKIKKEILEKMRKEFRFWYPMDLRVSAKDLIQNHLTMSLYNHACVWNDEPDLWPRSMFCNGMLMVNNEKMAKSKGNFYTLNEIIQKYSADPFRLACANSGDTLEDANLEEKVAEKALLAMVPYLELLESFKKGTEPTSTGSTDARFVDRWFQATMSRLAIESRNYYESMYYREALRTCYFEFRAAFDQYMEICRTGLGLPNKALVMQYFEWQAIILSPVCPHFCEHCWGLLGKSGSVLDSRFPQPEPPATNITTQGDYMFSKVTHDFIKLRDKMGQKPSSAAVYVAKEFPDWKVAVLELLRRKYAAGQLTLKTQEETKGDEVATNQWKEIIKELMQDPKCKKGGKHLGSFAAYKRDEAATYGPEALDASLPFDEMALVSEHIPFLKAKLQIEGDVCVLPAEQPQEAGHEEAASTAQPGKPSVFFVSSGGGGGKAAAGGGKKKSTAAVVTDLKKLNELLSTRSYIEDGPRPTAADEAQLQAMSQVVSSEDHPHVARWQKHIKRFTAVQRAAW